MIADDEEIALPTSSLWAIFAAFGVLLLISAPAAVRGASMTRTASAAEMHF